MNETTNTSIGDTITSLLDTPFSVVFSTVSNEALNILDNLHFVRADWFYAFIPFFIYLYLYSKKTQNNKNWQSVIDQNLLPFVLTKGSNSKRRLYPLFLIFIAGSLCITALAGPVYKKLPQPVYREQSAVVVLLDLSVSMNATDIKPSRLSRAKLKLLDILKARKTGQTALIAYAADAFVVTPLTDDNATIANLVPALETEMMPAQGSNLSLALAKAFSLFNQAGIIKGNILVVTDDIHKRDESAIEKVSSQGHRLSILGIGTTAGGPVPLLNSASGGFLLDKNGAIVIPKLQPGKLQGFALTGGGSYAELKVGDDDVNRLTRLFESSNVIKPQNQNENDNSSNDGSETMWADSWQEEGHWLLLPLLLLAALWARKGWIAVLLPFTLTLLVGTPQSAYAETQDEINSDVGSEQPFIDTDNLWSTANQKAMKAFNAGDNTKAAEHFTHPEWKASALYRDGDYSTAAEILDKTNTSDGYYNKANALAKQGKYPEAIKAYDSALELDQQNEDAKYNREQVKQALEKQQKNSKQDSDEQQQDNDKNNKDPSDSQQKNSDEQGGDEHNNESEDQKNEDSSKQQSEQPSSEEQQSEEQELKQRDAQKEKEQQEEEQQRYDQQQKEQQEQEQQSDSVENKDSDSDAEEDPLEIEVNPTEVSITEEEKATEQWLNRIPDDPGGLLRRKFLYQYSRTPNQTDSDEPW